MMNQFGATHLGVWAIKNLLSPIQSWIYQKSEGKAFSRFGSDRNVLLLTTRGRRTGKDRTIPVFYLHYGDGVVICNVRPESERINPWVINLRSHPVAQLQIGEEKGHYQARQATADEVDYLWRQLIKVWPPFKVHYEHGGQRSIFILEQAGHN